MCIFALLRSETGVILSVLLMVLFFIATLLPGLAVAIRRLHDLNKFWTWIFILLIPAGGIVWFLVLMCKAGTVGDNLYGSEPNAVSASDNSVSKL